jgi:protocatechuate 3,4-dioxygenase beta subunit
MCGIIRTTLFSVWSLSLLIGPARASAAQSEQTEARTGSISGRVTLNGKPVCGVVVLAKPGLLSGFFSDSITPKSKTDSDGRFKIINLSPGQYVVSTFAQAQVLRREFRPAGKPVVVSGGEEISDIDLSLFQGGVITGRITDEEGQPLIETYVRIEPVGGSFRGVNPIWRTDDRGVYRMYGLPPGRYFVSVGADADFPLRQAGARDYPRTFYPGTEDKMKALPVQISEGVEVTDIDIGLGKATKTFSVRGRALNEDGAPAGGLMLMGARMGESEQGFGSFGGTTSTDSNGAFVIEGLTPGKYGVFLTEQTGDYYCDVTPFEVTDSNVTGLELRRHRGSLISGFVVLEGSNDPEILGRLSHLMLGLFSRGTNAAPVSRQVSINQDGSFLVGGVRPGVAKFTLVNFPGGGVGFRLSRVEQDGTPLSDGIEVHAGAMITDIRVVLTYGSCVINGQVVAEGQEMPPGARWVVVATTKNGTQPQTATGYVDARLRFRIDGLPPGEYQLRLIRSGGGLTSQIPEMTVTLVDGVTDIVFTVDSSATRKEGDQ